MYFSISSVSVVISSLFLSWLVFPFLNFSMSHKQFVILSSQRVSFSSVKHFCCFSVFYFINSLLSLLLLDVTIKSWTLESECLDLYLSSACMSLCDHEHVTPSLYLSFPICKMRIWWHLSHRFVKTSSVYKTAPCVLEKKSCSFFVDYEILYVYWKKADEFFNSSVGLLFSFSLIFFSEAY